MLPTNTEEGCQGDSSSPFHWGSLGTKGKKAEHGDYIKHRPGGMTTRRVGAGVKQAKKGIFFTSLEEWDMSPPPGTPTHRLDRGLGKAPVGRTNGTHT